MPSHRGDLQRQGQRQHRARRHGEQAVDRHLRALYGLGRQLREPDGGRHRRRKHVGLQLDYLTHGRAMLGVGPGALISDATMMGIIP